jgi:hypothetical protein
MDDESTNPDLRNRPMTKREISEGYGRKYLVFVGERQVDYPFANLREAIRCAERHSGEVWRDGRRVA